MSLGILDGARPLAPAPRRGAPLSGTIDDLRTKVLGCKASLGFQKQTQPLPAGRYWIDVSGEDKAKEFLSGMLLAEQSGIIVIEDIDQDPPADISFVEALMRRASGPITPAIGMLFRVTGAGSISLDATKYGFPTKAPDCLATHAGTSTAQEASAEVDKRAKDKLDSIENWIIVGLAMAGLYMASNIVGNVARAAHEVRAK